MSDSPLAFAWARAYGADQLSAFIEDLWGAASGDNDLQTLDAIERVIADHRPDNDAVPCPLTARQIAVLTELACGETYESAGRKLEISGSTVHTMCRQICDLLRANNTMHAVTIATGYGWLTALSLPQPHPKPKRRNPIEGAARHRAHAAELREQPGVELCVGDYADRHTARTTARRIRKGGFSAYAPADSFEARPVQTDNGRWTIRAQYVGNSSDTSQEAAS
ncbi:LuxR C-terminal-related transcriptional regulator [Streptomyces cinnabarinus]|uniref:LuxR C-terminal-related transcriptional regulator n=1 Tax=Streptomyces cinnabarinus TaxID=67287 RepID=A0ABY7K7Z9_9ACTN|nr:LuxR C-terminal-related transcriptional regulator [Streptomyces cinnabarinus]WAZ20243.1 LuxR C-terminal-related transcriptional regulator [Streptomyces cinnabarinus]